MDATMREKLETLDGSRRRDAVTKAAVRIEDLALLLQVPPRLRSDKAAGSEPTKAEHDALVADMQDLHRALIGVAQALQRRILP